MLKHQIVQEFLNVSIVNGVLKVHPELEKHVNLKDLAKLIHNKPDLITKIDDNYPASQKFTRKLLKNRNFVRLLPDR